MVANKETARSRIDSLVNKFKSNFQACKKTTYLGAQLRLDFINDFFEALGWDVKISSKASMSNRDVIVEAKQEVEGRSKSPDYSFRVESRRKFFVEAKKPSIDITTNSMPAFQLRRYGWNASDLDVSILTNFEYFAVYDCNLKPNEGDNSKIGLLKLIHFENYIFELDYLWNTFSRDAVASGSLSKFERRKTQKGISSVDKDFLESLNSWRTKLAKDICKHNDIDEEQLNFLVQQTIDRIIFLRIAEDRDIEIYEILKKAINKPNAYKELTLLFKKADQKYNSGLFNQRIGQLFKTTKMSDDVLRKIVNELYYPKSPYEFSVIPIEILGKAYEQFLGTRIELTSGGNLKFNKKPEVRRAGGVYYTPRYIVEYIVEHTVGELVKGKAPEEIEQIKICDPASGSGSFLIYAFEYLLNYHKEYYKKKYEEGSKHYGRYFNLIGELNSNVKKKILINNIFGVDIDANAVEVTKLSLLLKCMEGETKASAQRCFDFNEPVLPSIENNIKCGNSLIDYDIMDDDELYYDLNRNRKLFRRINPFTWKKAFPEVFAKGGFDVIIGNPPWGASFQDNLLKYLSKKYSPIVVRMIDSFMYFLYASVQLVKENGPVGMILPDVIFYQIDNWKLRKFLLDTTRMRYLLNLGNVFEDVVRPSCIVIVNKNHLKDKNTVGVLDVSDKRNEFEKRVFIENSNSYSSCGQEFFDNLESFMFVTKNIRNYSILKKIQDYCHIQLSDILDDDGIQRGVSPDLKEAFLVDSRTAKKHGLEKSHLRPVLIGGIHVKKFNIRYPDLFVIYTNKNDDFKRLPNIRNFIDKFAEKITCKEVKEKKHPIYALHRPRKESIFKKSNKIVGVITEDQIIVALDTKNFYATDGLYLFGLKAEIDPKYVLGVLNSKLYIFLYRLLSCETGRVLAQVKPTIINKLPIRLDTSMSFLKMQKGIIELVNKITNLKNDKEPDKNLTGYFEEKIDKLVYMLYELKEKEIEIIEEAVNGK